MNLIRTIDGVETPAPGHWTIAGQLSGVRFGRDGTNARIVVGALVVGDDITDTALRLTVVAGGRSAAVNGRLVAADAAGRWRFEGTVTVNGSAIPAAIDVRYRGVFRHAGRAAAWLTIRVELPPARRSLPLARRHAVVLIDADVNADASVDVVAQRDQAAACIPASAA